MSSILRNYIESGGRKMSCLMNLNPSVIQLTFCPSLFSLHPLSLCSLITASSHHLLYKELRRRFCWLRSELTSPQRPSRMPALMSNQRAREKSRRRTRTLTEHQRQQKRKVSDGLLLVPWGIDLVNPVIQYICLF